jgi:uncharacterized phage protein (TIGR02218 family)
MIDLLGSKQNLYIAELVSMTLADGTLFNWTTAPVNIAFSGVTYSSFGPLLQLDGIQWRIGVETDELKLKLYCDPTNSAQLIEGAAVMAGVQNGLTDNALVAVQRLFTDSWGNWSYGAITLFHGNVSDSTADQAHAEFNIKSRKELFNIPFPYLTYQPGCQWPLYGAGCTLNPASFAVAGSVSAGSGALLLNTSLTQVDQYFSQGYITFTSGANVGVTRGIRQYVNASGQILLWIPLPNTPALGDTFNAYPGCDKLQSTCSGKFGNLGNFGGYPNIPIPETAI